MKPLLIGLSGKAGCGKTTVADYLREQHGYHQFAFATALKDVVGTAFAMTEDHLHGPLKEEIDPRWGVSPRYLMQWLGTEILRERWPDIWIRNLRQDILDFLGQNGQRRIVVADVRFRDEAEALKRLGARLWRLERPGHEGARNGIEGHVSETDLDYYRGWDAVLVASSKELLLEQVGYLMSGEAIQQ
jgi:hypothetical protein